APGRIQNDASERSNTNSANQENRGAGCIRVESKGPEWPADPNFTPGPQRFKYPLESRITHSRGKYEIFFEGCPGYRETSCIALGVSFRRIDQRDIDVLACLELKPCRLLQMERHGAFCYFPALLQFD